MPSMPSLKRGDIVRVRLDPVEGSEQAGERPALVISPDVINEPAPTGALTVSAITRWRELAVIRDSAYLPDGETDDVTAHRDEECSNVRSAQSVECLRHAWPYAVLPRFLRPRIAAAYLAMNKNSFNRLVRPMVHAMPLGKRAIAYDRLELDVWVEEYCRCNGRPPGKLEGQQSRENIEDSLGGKGSMASLSGTSTRKSRDMDAFARAVARTTRTRRETI